MLAEGAKRVVFEVPEDFPAEQAACLATGLHMGLYGFLRYKTGKQPDPPTLTLVHPEARWRTAAKRGLPVAAGVALARDLVNTPAEDMGPSELEAEARKVGEQAGLKVRVLDAKRCERMGMGALTAVGRASDDPPRIVVLEHRGAPRSKDWLALGGKGICFDTGGLDLKPASGMLLMKKDMGGAATVLGTALALGLGKVKANVRIYLAIAENAVAGNAFRPGDVLRAMNGTTIEIGNTDAEGRLVLADAVCLAVKEGATRIVDAATLTGAAMIALGRIYVPMMGNDDDLVAALETASEATGERVWRLPADDEYREHIRSNIADIKNVGRGREAGVIAAGLFIEHFAGDVPWAHLDISPASGADSPHDLGPEGATGVMVATLAELARK